MNRYTCGCGWSMPASCERAIAAHQQVHPTEEQRRERDQRSVLARVSDATHGGRPLSVIERLNAINAYLTASPELVADEVFFKPIRKELAAMREEPDNAE